MNNIDNLCMGCMSEIGNENVCPYCNERKDELQEAPFMPKGTIIGERYIVGKGLKINGEGLSYIGYDKIKKMRVYIREFYPSNICSRNEGHTDIKVLGYQKSIFEKELIKFLKYFRSVARLRNLSQICAVYDIFKENKTAYVIFEWIDGISFDRFLGDRGGRLSWSEVRAFFMPLLSSLRDMHLAKVRHLGISPQNMIITPAGKIKLVGFSIKDLRKKDSVIEVQLYDGCSAIEQYINAYQVDDSTDVYGFAASMFLALTGEYPPEASKRKQDDRLLMPQEIVKTIPGNVISALASALRVYSNNRTLSFERLRAELADSPLTQIDIEKKKPQPSALPVVKNKKVKEKSNTAFMWGMISCAVALAVLLVCLILYWFFWKNKDNSESIPYGENTKQLVDISERVEETSQIDVPDLRGKSFTKLQSELTSGSDYKVAMTSEEFSDDVDEGGVISQNPSYGEKAEKGVTIAVTVSKGSKMRTLPDIRGKTISEASLAVSNAKLKPVEAREYNDNISEGIVMGYKDKNAGDKVEYGTEVTILVSKGKANQ